MIGVKKAMETEVMKREGMPMITRTKQLVLLHSPVPLQQGPSDSGIDMHNLDKCITGETRVSYQCSFYPIKKIRSDKSRHVPLKRIGYYFGLPTRMM